MVDAGGSFVCPCPQAWLEKCVVGSAGQVVWDTAESAGESASTLFLVPQMATAYCCLSLFLLSTWVALLLQPLQGAWGAPLEPVYPGDYATPEQMAQYATQLRRYINTQTRPR